MRSKIDNIVPLSGTAFDRVPEEIYNRYSHYPAYLRGGSGKNFKKNKFWARHEVVTVYLNNKRAQGGDPLMSTAVQLGVDALLVERVLDVEIGRPPNRLNDVLSERWEVAVEDWRKRQAKLDKKYGPVVTNA